MKIAFLGTGLMGQPMAARLAGAGHEVWAYNRTRDKAEALAAQGCRVADEPGAAVQAAEGVVLMLSDEAAIRQALLRGAGAHLDGRSVVQMGTIGPAQSKALAAEVEALGGDYLEAPVLGSIPEAREGRLIVMVGASPQQFARWAPVLAALGPDPLHLGAVGRAAAVKLALNQLIGSLTTAFSLSLALVQREGVDPEAFMGILRQSALYAPTFDKKLARMLSHDYGNPNFPTRHMLKDVRLVLGEAERLGLASGMLAGVRDVLEDSVARGLADGDYSALFEAVAAPRRL